MYALDTQEARKADAQGNQIKELGKYIGTITQAEDITAKTGTKGIALSFTSNSGQKSKLSIYTMKSDGSKIGGFSMLSAMMTCMKLRDISPKAGKVKSYNYDAKAEVEKDGQLFPTLCKPIGVLLETEDFAKIDGSTGTRMVLRGVFQADTELTASEILDRKTVPEALPKMVAALRHRPFKAASATAPRTHTPTGAVGSGFDDMDDDIPF
jgi:hypothetical protein